MVQRVFLRTARQHFLVLPLLVASLHTHQAHAEMPDEFWQKWKSINYYNASGESEVKNADFFISPQGRSDSNAEFRAFEALSRTFIKTGDHTETLCKYPARMALLKQHTKWFTHTPNCADFNKKFDPQNIESISLIYASGYFDNPSSYYGHTLLRFNYNKKAQHTGLDGGAINYGARDISNNPFSYIIKGIFGGYTGAYFENDDLIHTHNYTNKELRDVWDYRLDLSPQEQDFLIAQLWELRRAQFPYYFFNDNCAHRITRPIENTIGETLSDTHGFWLMPIQVMHNIKTSTRKIAASETRNLSKKSEIKQKLKQASSTDIHGVTSFLTAKPEQQAQITKALPNKSLLLSLDQLDIQIAKLKNKERQTEKHNNMERQRHLLLVELFKRNIKSPWQKTQADTHKKTPLTSAPASNLYAGYKHGRSNSAFNITYEPALNDLLDTPMQGQGVSRFIMGGFSIDFDRHDINLRKATIIDILNLSDNPLPSSITQEHSWGLTVEYSAKNASCTGCGTFKTKGLIGKSVNISNNTKAFALGGIQLDHKRLDGHQYASPIATTGIVSKIDAQSKIKATINLQAKADFSKTEPRINIDYAQQITPQQQARISLEKLENRGGSLAFQWGWAFN